MSKLSIIKELFGFLHREKKWWLIPLIVMLVMLALVIISMTINGIRDRKSTRLNSSH